MPRRFVYAFGAAASDADAELTAQATNVHDASIVKVRRHRRNLESTLVGPLAVGGTAFDRQQIAAMHELHIGVSGPTLRAGEHDSQRDYWLRDRTAGTFSISIPAALSRVSIVVPDLTQPRFGRYGFSECHSIKEKSCCCA